MARRTQMKRASRAVRVGPTRHGLGVFARRAFPQGTIIAEIRGSVVEDAEYDSSYCMELDGERVLEPRAPLRFLNHSCEPNCEIVSDPNWDDEAGRVQHTLYLMTLTGVAPGVQLTIDYAWPARHAIRCECGSPNCRGWIVAHNELDGLLTQQTQEEILEHRDFSEL